MARQTLRLSIIALPQNREARKDDQRDRQPEQHRPLWQKTVDDHVWPVQSAFRVVRIINIECAPKLRESLATAPPVAPCIDKAESAVQEKDQGREHSSFP